MAIGNPPEYTIADILKATDYALTIFEDEEKAAIELFDRKGKPYLRDFADGKERPAKPEEIVRQLFLYRFSNSKFDTIWAFQRFLLRLASISSGCSIDLTNQRKFAS